MDAGRGGAGGWVGGGIVVVVRDLDALGGTERKVRELTRAWAAAGRAVDVWTCEAPGPRVAPRRGRVERRDGVVVRWAPLPMLEALLGVWLYRRPCQAVYTTSVMMGAISTRAAAVAGVPVVLSIECGGPFGDAAELERLPPALRRDVVRDLSRAHLVTISQQVHREAAEVGLPADRVTFITNGVAADVIARATPVRPAGDRPTLLFAGRLSPQKGLDLLLAALPRVRAEVPDVRLLLAGEGPSGPELRAQAAREGLGDAVVFLGTRDDVWGLMRGATAVVLPSRAEGLSLMLLEALAAGCPVVASRIPPNAEALGQDEPGGPCGVLVDAEDPAALAAGLVDVLRRPELRADLAARGRARVAARFSLEAVARAHLALFDALAATGHDRPGPAAFVARFAAARGRDVLRRLALRPGR